MLVRPHLQFYAQFWSPLDTKDEDGLERVQSWSRRTIRGLKILLFEESLKESGLLTSQEAQAGPHHSIPVLKGWLYAGGGSLLRRSHVERAGATVQAALGEVSS